jgi:AmiR/NasT family two-component response regulator
VSDQPLRVVVLAGRPVLGELIRAELARTPRVEVVAEVADLIDLPPVVARLSPDVVVCGVTGTGGFPEGHAEFFADPRPARLLVAFSDARAAALWELRPSRVELGEFSTDLLSRVLAGVRD